MSIKRVKQVQRGPRNNDAGVPPTFPKNKKPPEKKWIWADDVATKPEDAFLPYRLDATFAEGAFLLHSKFGKGVITRVEGANIAVLFEEGPKKLRHTPVPTSNLIEGSLLR